LKRLVLKVFRNKKEQTEVFQNFSGGKENNQRRSKLFRNEVEQTDGIPELREIETK